MGQINLAAKMRASVLRHGSGGLQAMPVEAWARVLGCAYRMVLRQRARLESVGWGFHVARTRQGTVLTVHTPDAECCLCIQSRHLQAPKSTVEHRRAPSGTVEHQKAPSSTVEHRPHPPHSPPYSHLLRDEHPLRDEPSSASQKKERLSLSQETQTQTNAGNGAGAEFFDADDADAERNYANSKASNGEIFSDKTGSRNGPEKPAAATWQGEALRILGIRPRPAEALPPEPAAGIAADDTDVRPRRAVRYDSHLGMMVSEEIVPPDGPLAERVRETVVEVYRLYRGGAAPPTPRQVARLIENARSVLPASECMNADAVVEAIRGAVEEYLLDEFGGQFKYALSAVVKPGLFESCWQRFVAKKDEACRRAEREARERLRQATALAERQAAWASWIRYDKTCPACKREPIERARLFRGRCPNCLEDLSEFLSPPAEAFDAGEVERVH